MTDEVRIPTTLDEVDADWLSAALGATRPEVKVVAATFDEDSVIHGTATKAKLRLVYEGDRGDLPDTMYVKAGLDDYSAAVATLGIYARESHYYANLRDEFPVRSPACYYTAADRASGRSIMLLEDLDTAGATFNRALRPATPEMVAGTLDALAQLHAMLWEDPRLEQVAALDFDPTSPPAGADGRAMLRLDLSRPAAASLPAVFRDETRIMTALSTASARHTSPRCLIHGDAHFGNTFVAADGAYGFVDWQNWKDGHWSRDVTYFMCSALDLPDRRKHERDLLKHYLGSLAAHGARPPNFEDAWVAYREDVIYGLYCWAMNPAVFQPDVINVANTTRFGMAALDLGTFDLLERG